MHHFQACCHALHGGTSDGSGGSRLCKPLLGTNNGGAREHSHGVHRTRPGW